MVNGQLSIVNDQPLTTDYKKTSGNHIITRGQNKKRLHLLIQAFHQGDEFIPLFIYQMQGHTP
jgi:hypothetical protein